MAFIGFSNTATLSRERRPNSCRVLEFRCDNGECIPDDNLCNGQVNCADGSDETRQQCMRPEIICPDFSFRCNYGACVDGDAICNGINDCIDKSDQQLPRCRVHSSNFTACGND